MTDIQIDAQTSAASSHQPQVTVRIVDPAWVEQMSFAASKTNSLTEDAQAAWYELPTSCCAGACFVCGGRVKQGMEYIDIGKISVPLIDIDEDQVLMCVWGVHDHAFTDGQHHEIVIEKDI
jgi:ferredoxin